MEPVTLGYAVLTMLGKVTAALIVVLGAKDAPKPK